MIDRLQALRSELSDSGIPPSELRPFTDLLDSSADVFARDHYRPGHITGSAFVVHPSRSALALVHHDKLDLWVQPGGHVEPEDDTVADGARREVMEEIGLNRVEPLGLIDVDVHVFPKRTPQPRHLHFDIRYAFRAGEERTRAGEGVRDLRWVAKEEALAMDESVARAVRRLALLLGW
jgi:8-oxo-dGTP pyrophosphatase MutT (NUDIX family)